MFFGSDAVFVFKVVNLLALFVRRWLHRETSRDEHCKWLQNCYFRWDRCLCLSVGLSQAIPRKLWKSCSSNLAQWLPQTWKCMHHMLLIMTLTIIQGHTDHSHEIINVWLFQKLFQQCFQVCCEDSPTRGLNIPFSVRWPWHSFKVTIASQTWPMFYLYYNTLIVICPTLFKLRHSNLE